MRLTSPQETIAKSKARFRVAVCGRRFGKSVVAFHEISKVAANPGMQIWYVAPTYKQCKNIAWSKLKKIYTYLGWLEKSNETSLTLELINGTVISLKNATNPDSLRGVGLDFVVLDEFAFMNKRVWTEAIRPMLSTTGGSGLFITTPKGTANWSYDLYNAAVDQTNKQWEAFHFTSVQGGYISEDEIEQAKNDLSLKEFKQEYEASFETSGSLIAYAFSRKHNVVELAKNKYNTDTLYVGCDFNVNPCTACIMIKQGEDLYVIDELALPDSNTNEMADEIRNRYPKAKIMCYPDPAGRQRKTSANGQTDFTILQNADFVVKAPLAHDAVRDRINATNARFCNAKGERHLFVLPHCKHTIASLERHMFKDGTQIPDKESGFDHQFDSLSYAVAYLFPVKRDREEYEPRRFGHAIK